MKRHLWQFLYTLALLGFSVYVLLDTFVITRVYIAPDDTQTSDSAETSGSETDTMETYGQFNESEESDEADSSSEAQITSNSYEDENIKISITEYVEYSTHIYVADIVLSSASYLKTALASGSYGKNVTAKTSEIAADCGAILAINGDYYGARERGYVLRNGTLYRSTASLNQEDLVIYGDGSFDIINESSSSAGDLLSAGASQILSFGPALVLNGTINVSENDEVGKAMASNPRTAIACVDSLHYLFIVSDGRTSESTGLSLYELAQFSVGLGAQTVYNLDGGGSSTMYFNGTVVNKPTTNGDSIKERKVSDIVYIGY